MVREKEADDTIQQIHQFKNPTKHAAEQYLDLIKLANIPVIDTNYCFTLPPKIDLLAKTYRKSYSDKYKRIVGVHCGNHVLNTNYFLKKVPFVPRVWSSENFIGLIKLLNKNYPDTLFVLTGGFYEKKITKKIAKILKKANIANKEMAGKTKTMSSFLALLKSFDLYISTDTGPMHVAAAIETPLLDISCSIDPIDTGPLGNPEKYIVIEPDISCHPCLHTEHEVQCPKGTNCVQDLTPDKVVKKGKDFLNSIL
jgi:ADP-heptose:LPS heptosyltransferase